MSFISHIHTPPNLFWTLHWRNKVQVANLSTLDINLSTILWLMNRDIVRGIFIMKMIHKFFVNKEDLYICRYMQLSIVSRLKNEYIVELLGYCLEENNRILIYEYAPMGSLHDVLHGIHLKSFSSLFTLLYFILNFHDS